MQDLLTFGEWLRRSRKALDLTRNALADRVGCSAALIRKLETEERRPSEQVALRLAEIFEISPAERAAFIRFSRGDWAAGPDLRKPAGAWTVQAAGPRINLPHPPSSLVGREPVIRSVREALSAPGTRLLTLVGPPGIGKTRLALAAAAELAPDFYDGTYFIPLSPLVSGEQVSAAAARSLGITTGDSLSYINRLATVIGRNRVLLVLDNCEHVIEAAAALASNLLAAVPSLKVMATSREALRIPGEWLYEVPALAFPDRGVQIDPAAALDFPALALFVERARAARSDFSLNANNLAYVREICERLDGLPLGIELLAARVRFSTPQALLGRFDEQFVLSADGMRAVPTRQKTLQDAIAWTYDALTAAEQTLYKRLAVFSGGFTPDAVDAVCRSDLGEKSAIELLAGLAEKSLLRGIPDAFGSPRFSMLAVMRQFAMKKLHQSPEAGAVRDRHLAYFRRLAEIGDAALQGKDQVYWADLLALEYDNFNTALDWAVRTGNAESGLIMLGALGWAWEIRAHYATARAWYIALRNVADADEQVLPLSKTLTHLGRHSWTQDDIPAARVFLAESIRLAESAGSKGAGLLSEALNGMGLIAVFVDSDVKMAVDYFTRALELSEGAGERRGVAISIFHLGIAAQSDGRIPDAFQLYERSRKLFYALGDQFYLARTALFMGYCFMREGDFERAEIAFKEHLQIDQDLKFWDGIAEGWRDLGQLARTRGEPGSALHYYDRGVQVCLEHGLWKYDVFFPAGLQAMRNGEAARAGEYFVRQLRSQLAIGISANRQALWMGLAAAYAAQNEPELAARLYGAAVSLEQEPGQKLDPNDLAFFEDFLDLAKNALGLERFIALAGEGSQAPQEAMLDSLP